MDISSLSNGFDDLIMGIHSMREAILNPKREKLKVIGTKDGIRDLTKGMSKAFVDRVYDNSETFSLHSVQEVAKSFVLQWGLTSTEFLVRLF